MPHDEVSCQSDGIIFSTSVLTCWFLMWLGVLIDPKIAEQGFPVQGIKGGEEMGWDRMRCGTTDILVLFCFLQVSWS